MSSAQQGRPKMGDVCVVTCGVHMSRTYSSSKSCLFWTVQHGGVNLAISRKISSTYATSLSSQCGVAYQPRGHELGVAGSPYDAGRLRRDVWSTCVMRIFV